MFLLQIDEIANIIAVLFSIAALTEATIWQGLSKNRGAVPNWKYFQISSASKPPGVRRKDPFHLYQGQQ